MLDRGHMRILKFILIVLAALAVMVSILVIAMTNIDSYGDINHFTSWIVVVIGFVAIFIVFYRDVKITFSKSKK